MLFENLFQEAGFHVVYQANYVSVSFENQRRFERSHVLSNTIFGATFQISNRLIHIPRSI